MGLPDSTVTSRLSKLVAVVLVVVVLRFGEQIIKPVALAVLLAFLLAPLVSGLERLGSRRVLAVISVVAVSFLAIGGLGWLVGEQMVDLAGSITRYRANIVTRVESLRPGPEGVFGRVGAVVAEVRDKLAGEGEVEPEAPLGAPVPAPGSPARPAAGGDAEPIPVREVPPPRSPAEVLIRNLGPVLTPVATAGVVIVLVIFFLLQREDLRNRLIRLVGEGQLLVTTQAMDEAGRRVSRYLLTQLVVNGLYGVLAAVGLTVIGVPNALLWGLLAIVLRYLPYVGPWIAATAPIFLALAVFPGWGRPLAAIGMFIVLELVFNNFVEPIVYGSSIGVAPVSLLLAALFWTWLWGPLGLVLAAPLTVCLVVLGRHVPHLEFLSVLFGDEPVLPPGVRLYQRLLARDQVEAIEVVDRYFGDDRAAGPADFYDRVLVPALALAEADRRRGALAPELGALVRQALEELMEDAAARAGEAVGAPLHGRRILCLAVTGEADALAATMFARAAKSAGAFAEVVSPSGDEGVDVPSRVDVACVSTLPPAALIQTRHLVRAIRARHPTVTLLVGVWHAEDDEADAARASLIAIGADAVVTEIGDALVRARGDRTPTGTFVLRDLDRPPPAS